MRLFIISILLVFVVLGGCEESQSPNVKFVNDIEVGLYFDPCNFYFPTEYAWQLDKWCVHDGFEGHDIYTATFGYQVKVTMDMAGVPVPVAGIRVDCYIEHTDPMGGDADIWDKVGPDGEKYGFVTGYPDTVIHWNPEDGHASSKTDRNGLVIFGIGLGGPDYEMDFGWLWPDYGDEVRTGIKLTIVVRRNNGSIIKEVSCIFLRFQHAGFWWPSGGGVLHTSVSTMSPAPEFWVFSAMETMAEGIKGEIIEGGTMEPGAPNLVGIPERSEPPESYPIVGNLAVSFETKEDTIEGGRIQSQGDFEPEWWFVERMGWGTLIYEPMMGGWVWLVEETALKGLVSPDPNEPNDAVEMLSTCQPHAFFCELSITSPKDFNAISHTFIVTSKDADGNDVSWFPIKMFPYGIWGYDVCMMSEYIIPIDSPVGEGRYINWWGWPGTLIYVPEGGYLEVDYDSFYGDFNFDGLVDFKDFGWLMKYWRQNMTNTGYDLHLDANQDFQIDVNDLTAFMENWLKERL